MKDRKSKLKALFTIKNLAFLLILVIFFMQFFQVQAMRGTLSKIENTNSSLITEIGQIKSTYTSFTDNMNEVRKFLRMPEVTPAFAEPEAGEQPDQEGKNENELQLAMFRYVEHLSSNRQVTEKLNQRRALLDQLLTNESFNSYLSQNSLTLGTVQENDQEISLTVSVANAELPQPLTLISFVIHKIDGAMFLNSPLSSESISYENVNQLADAAQDFLDDNRSKIIQHQQDLNAQKQLILDTLAQTDISQYLSDNSITIATDPLNETDKLIYSIQNSSAENVGQILLHKKDASLELVDLRDAGNNKKTTSLASDLLPFLKNLETATHIEKSVAEAKANLEDTIKNDSGFKSVLKQSQLQVATTPREDEDRYYYDITDAQGNFVSSIALEKATAVVNIVDANGTNAQNLLFFDPEFSKKKTLELPDQIPEYSDELVQDDDTFDILIAGRNGNLVDTMIFAHVNETRGTVRMVSVPRDLHYNGRKINSLAFYYGMDELVKALSQISGYQLDKYILIDLEAFIEVIDLIGGIEVTLEKALIDPTYRTVDNGVEGTLHYEPGTYHLGGVEALRLARSRYTSSDFARAERQQMILEAIQEKARNFGFGDSGTIYDIAKSVLSKTETDISLDEAIVYFFRYQNYSIESNAVMSSGNVLYSPPYITSSQCDNMIASAEAAGQPTPDCRNKPNAYTLVPRDNNWNLIKWFFQKEFEELET